MQRLAPVGAAGCSYGAAHGHGTTARPPTQGDHPTHHRTWHGAPDREVSAADDRLAVGDLVARYVEAVALADRDLFRSVWAADSVWVVDGRGSFHGPDAITDLFWKLRSRQELAVQRVVSGRAVVHDDATAAGRWVIHSVTRSKGEGAELIGVYDDHYVREAHGWRFRERAFTPLYRGPRTLDGTVFAPRPLPPLPVDAATD